MSGHDLFIFSEYRLEPVFSAKVKGKTAAYALLRFGLKRKDFSRVLSRLDRGEEVSIGPYKAWVNGGAPMRDTSTNERT